MTKKIDTLADLTPDGENFNRHTEFGQKLLEDSLRKFGAGRSILVDCKGNIIAGNSTAETAAAIGMEDVIVVPTDGKKLVVVQRTDLSLDSPEGREMALADNMTALKGIDLDLAKVQETLGDDLAKAWGMEIPEVQRKAQEDDFDPDSVTETVCKKGDLWKLGNHRLMCGDSTDAGDVALLMDGEKADLCLTDPPYGIKRDKGFGGFEGFGGFGQPIARRQYNDDWDSFTPSKECFDLMLQQANKAVVFGGNFFTDKLPQGNHWLVWNKHNTMPTFGDAELAWTNIDRNSVKIIDIQYNGLLGKEKERFHPTQKPVKLFFEILSEYTKEGDNIIDLFGGSGTTLIAAEQLNRKCYMMELDPHYCDVIIARWEKLTGNKAERISNGND